MATAGKRRPRILVLEALWGSAECIREAGGTPITVNPRNVDKLAKVLANETIDGVLLTGGGDVDPRRYGEKPHEKVYGVSEVRDLVETYVLGMARENGWPVLGICRGEQLMAIDAGGTLVQHIEGHRGKDHPVTTTKGSTLRREAGESFVVVSLHHQVVDLVPDGWSVTATAKDGVAEAIESDDGRCLGVQFHPEMDENARYARSIFRWLVLESAERAGLGRPTTRKPRKFEPLPKSKGKKAKKAKAGQPQLPPVKSVMAPKALIAPRGFADPISEVLGDPVLGDKSVDVSWFCPTCRIRFDKQEDRNDHLRFIHPGHDDSAFDRLGETA